MRGPATLRINGFTPEELKNKDTFELIHPEDRALVARVMGEVLAAPGARRTVEYRYLTKDGRWLWMEAVASIAASAALSRLLPAAARIGHDPK